MVGIGENLERRAAIHLKESGHSRRQSREGGAQQAASISKTEPTTNEDEKQGPRSWLSIKCVLGKQEVFNSIPKTHIKKKQK